MSVLYVPIGRTTFDMEAADHVFEQTSKWLSDATGNLISPEGIITSPEELDAFLDQLGDRLPTSIIYQSVTFADGQFIKMIIDRLNAPITVWSVREPSMGGRLRLNSLTGGNSTCHVLKSHNRPFSFVFGDAAEEAVQKKVTSLLNVHATLDSLLNLTIGVIGEHPPGFYFSGTEEDDLKTSFGVGVKHLDLHEAFEAANALPPGAWEETLDEADRQLVDLDRKSQTTEQFARFTTHLKKQITTYDLKALAIRCWPDFFNDFGAAACSTLSHLTEGGVVSACESDIHGSLSMYILRELSGGHPPYLGDLVHVNEENNAVVFWHCGASAYSLANSKTGATTGVHPNRKIGLTMEFGLKAGHVTIFRVGQTAEGYRLLVIKGEALDVPKRFHGTTVEVKLPGCVNETMTSLMQAGYEPHYAIVYADIADELCELGRLLGIPVELITE